MPLPLNPDPLIVISPVVPITRGEGETEVMAITVPGEESLMPWSAGQGQGGAPQLCPAKGSPRSTPLMITFPTATPFTKPVFTVATLVLLLPKWQQKCDCTCNRYSTWMSAPIAWNQSPPPQTG